MNSGNPLQAAPVPHPRHTEPEAAGIGLAPTNRVLTISLTDHADKNWDRFVEQHPSATVAHLSGWGAVVHGTYGHEPLYLTATEGGDVLGVLPLVFIRSRLFGRRLVSMPFLDYGGVLAEPGSPVERGLLDAVMALARERGAQSLGLRQFHATGLGAVPAANRVTMLLDLGAEADVWKSLSSERRNRVRKGEKHGLVPVWGGAELLDEFYRVYTVNMRDLGSPPHARRFFTLMLEHLPGVARALLVRDRDGGAVGAAVCMFFRDTIMVPWVSSLREAFSQCPNFVLYWEVIRTGCRNGYRTLDLGRSFRHKGTYEFKRQWGARDYTLPWLFQDVVAGAAPSVDRDSSRFDPLVNAWKRLPVSVANAIGPWIRGQAPN